MRMAPEIQRLRAEHSALATLSHFLMDIIVAPRPPRPTELGSVRGLLRDTLLRHLRCEDWALYPRLKAIGDPKISQMARRFSAEMGHIADDFITYDAKWTPERIEAEWDDFRGETMAMLEALGTRIKRENRDLYPVVERMIEQQHPPVYS